MFWSWNLTATNIEMVNWAHLIKTSELSSYGELNVYGCGLDLVLSLDTMGTNQPILFKYPNARNIHNIDINTYPNVTEHIGATVLCLRYIH